MIASATVVALCGGVVLTPQYQLWQWSRQYPSADAARAALSRNPNDTRAHFTLAIEVMRREDWPHGTTKAERNAAMKRQWEEVLRCDPNNEVAAAIYAPFLIRGSQADKARAKELLLPIARRGNVKTRPEAVKMLADMGVRAL